MRKRLRLPTIRISRARLERWRRYAQSLLTSLAINVTVLLLLFLIAFDRTTPVPTVLRIYAEMEDVVVEPPDFLEAIDTDLEPIGLSPKDGLGGSTPPAAAEIAPNIGPTRPPAEVKTTSLQRLEAFAPSRPLTHAPEDLELGQNVPGVLGTTVEAGSVAGTVDKITQEILRQLQKGPVLVVWVLDSSGSLAERRDEVFDRFDRVNRELADLGKMKEELLLNAVVGFGHETRFLTDKPLSDLDALRKAVESFEVDESGEEHVFSAIRAAAQKYRRYQTQGRRTVMMIVVTDEVGDDLEAVDDCVSLVKRNRIPVYVLGPMAPFGRKVVEVPWVDEPTGEVFQIPIDRGPESVQAEHLALPYWAAGPQYDLFPSGFGPFGLTLLATRSGGIYFVFDDGKIPGPKFHAETLARYAPDYMTLADYAKMLSKNPLRAAVIEAVRLSEESLGQPRTSFGAERLNESLSDAQRTAAATIHVADQAIAILARVEKERKSETSPRWQAHFDLMMGRLLATRIRANEYNWALAQMKVTPLPLAADHNAWRLVGDEEVRFGKPIRDDAKKAKRDPKITKQAQEDAEKAIELLKGVVRDRPGTPWELLAQRELEVPLGFRWESFYIPPPPKIEVSTDPNPPPPRVNPREEAAKRVPKL